MSKKLTALLLALTMALSLVAPCNAANKAKASVPQSYATEWDEDADKMDDGVYMRHNSYQVTKNLLLRATPNGKILATIPAKTSLIDLGGAPSGWTRVCYNGQYGICGTQYLAPTVQAAESWAMTTKKVQAYYNTKCTDKAKMLAAGAVVYVIGRTVRANGINICPVRYGGRTYFVKANGLCFVGEKPIKVQMKKASGGIKKGQTVYRLDQIGTKVSVGYVSAGKLKIHAVPQKCVGGVKK